MIDERFSSDAFASCGLNTDEAQALADLLEAEVAKEINQLVDYRLREIVEKLNSMGHTLKLQYPPEIGDICYRDDWEDETGYHCKLRLCVDTIISTGYAHLIDNSDVNID